jgi:hypothetical protein
MARPKNKLDAVKKFVTQLCLAAIAVTCLWFAGVGLSRTVIARPFGGNQPGPHGVQITGPRTFKVPKGFKPPQGLGPLPGQTLIPGKHGTANVVIYLNRGEAAIDWNAWMSALHIVLLIGVIAFALAMADRGLRIARRRRTSPL